MKKHLPQVLRDSYSTTPPKSCQKFRAESFPKFKVAVAPWKLEKPLSKKKRCCPATRLAWDDSHPPVMYICIIKAYICNYIDIDKKLQVCFFLYIYRVYMINPQMYSRYNVGAPPTVPTFCIWCYVNLSQKAYFLGCPVDNQKDCSFRSMKNISSYHWSIIWST